MLALVPSKVFARTPAFHTLLLACTPAAPNGAPKLPTAGAVPTAVAGPVLVSVVDLRGAGGSPGLRLGESRSATARAECPAALSPVRLEHLLGVDHTGRHLLHAGIKPSAPPP
jgi:hypothetical protein